MKPATIYDVSEQDFEQDVMARSKDVPVLLDLWAPWCQPCKQLTPILEEVVEEFGGRVLLAKVDIDQNPGLAQALRVQSIPMVMLFIDGQPVDGFMGAQRPEFIREMLRKHVPTTTDDVLGEAKRMLDAGAIEQAADALDRVLAEESDNHDARLLRARVALAAGDEDGVKTHVGQLPEESRKRVRRSISRTYSPSSRSAETRRRRKRKPPRRPRATRRSIESVAVTPRQGATRRRWPPGWRS